MINVGYLAEFKTGYLQHEVILHQSSVTGGIDASVYNSSNLGYKVGRLVKISKNTNGTFAVILPTTGVGSIVADTSAADKATKVAAGIGDATHIIAQSDNSVRNTPDEYIPVEKYSTRYDGIVRNTTDTAVANMKSIAVYKIVNADDIKLVDVDRVTRS